MTRASRLLFVLTSALAIVLASCSQPTDVAEVPEGEATETETIADVTATGPGAAEQQTDEFEGRVEAEDQASDGSTVTVARANVLVGRGWAVVYDDADGAPGEPIGWAQIVANQGDEPLTVDLDRELPAGETTLWVVLHLDADPVGEFDVGTDEVVTDDGDTVRDSFTVVVEDA